MNARWLVVLGMLTGCSGSDEPSCDAGTTGPACTEAEPLPTCDSDPQPVFATVCVTHHGQQGITPLPVLEDGSSGMRGEVVGANSLPEISANLTTFTTGGCPPLDIELHIAHYTEPTTEVPVPVIDAGWSVHLDFDSWQGDPLPDFQDYEALSALLSWDAETGAPLALTISDDLHPIFMLHLFGEQSTQLPAWLSVEAADATCEDDVMTQSPLAFDWIEGSVVLGSGQSDFIQVQDYEYRLISGGKQQLVDCEEGCELTSWAAYELF